MLLIGLSAGLFLVVGGTASVFAGRRERERRAFNQDQKDYAATQSEFAETLQLLGEEQEAHQLVKRHLERTLPAATATILSRNNSANRLEASTEPPSETEVAKRLTEGVEPRACLATRLGELQERGPGETPLLPCDLCGAEPDATTCAPLLVSGEVIGAVLVQHEQAFGERDRHRVTESVSHASPVIGNLRNLALAETRAATDALTGLPNRRALQDTVRRMVAQAGRTLDPLAVLAVDLDHFKQINDQFGHEKGDDVLAAVGPLLADGVRESDFVARAGGEEFSHPAPGHRPGGRGRGRREAPPGDRPARGPRRRAPDHRQLRHLRLPAPGDRRADAPAQGGPRALPGQGARPQPRRGRGHLEAGAQAAGQVSRRIARPARRSIARRPG